MRKVSALLDLDLADNGSGRPVDAAALAAALEPHGRGRGPAARVLATIAAGLREGRVRASVALSAADADRVRLTCLKLAQAAIDHRTGAADLIWFRKQWEHQTGWQAGRQCITRDAGGAGGASGGLGQLSWTLGSGYGNQ